jgi:hypothetical protein
MILVSLYNYIKSKKIILLIIILIPVLCLGIVGSCSSINEDSGIIRLLAKPGINPEYLGLSEKIILDFYGDENDRIRSIETLKARCYDTTLKDAHACYNLAVLLYNQKKMDESFTAIRKSVSIAGSDPLYQSMLRTMALQLGKPEILEEKEETRLLGTLTRLELLCSKNEEKSKEIMVSLLKQGILNSSMLNIGGLSDCITPQMKEEIIAHSLPVKYNYKDIYYQEKAKSDPFSGLWDVSYYIKKKHLEDEETINNTLTLNWKLVRKNVKLADLEKAKSHLKLFLGELRNHPYQKTEKKKLQSIEKAAYLLIEQDDFFSSARQLLQEF